MSLVTIIVGTYLGASASAYIAHIVHPVSVATASKPTLNKPTTTTPKTTTTPAVKTPATPVTTTAPKTVVTTVPPAAVVTTKTVTPTTSPTPVIVPAPSSDVPSLAPAPTTTTTTTTTTTGTTPTSSTTNYTSTNWSGYFATGGSYTSIAGAWTVTSPTGNGTSTTADASWIGIGGVSSNDLIQVGTENTVNAAGQVSTQAFYELLPASSRLIQTMTVNPGDSMQASLTQNAGQWTITITDLTSTQTYTNVVHYTSSLSSAEWIEEDPFHASGTQIPFDMFGGVTFTGAYTTNNGLYSSLSSISPSKITMVNQSGASIAVPSAIGSDGASFSVSSQ